jgi:HEAT repeat protein
VSATARLAGLTVALGGVLLAVTSVPQRGSRPAAPAAPAAARPPTRAAPDPRALWPTSTVSVLQAVSRIDPPIPNRPARDPARLERVLSAASERITAPGVAPCDVEPALRALAGGLDPAEREQLAAVLSGPDREAPVVLAAAELLRVLDDERPNLNRAALAALRSASAEAPEGPWMDAAARSLAALGDARDRALLIEALGGPETGAVRAARALRQGPDETLVELAWTLAGRSDPDLEGSLLDLIEAGCASRVLPDDGLTQSLRDGLSLAGEDPSRDAATRRRIAVCLAQLIDDPRVAGEESKPSTFDPEAGEGERRRALYALGAGSRPEAFEIVADACLADPSPRVRTAGVRALRGQPAERRGPILTTVARTDPSAAVRAQAAQELRILEDR